MLLSLVFLQGSICHLNLLTYKLRTILANHQVFLCILSRIDWQRAPLGQASLTAAFALQSGL